MDEAQYDAASAAAPGNVWARLKAAREAHGLSLPELANRTRVTQRFLEALEEGRPNDLPSPTYASGFSKAYARAVGLDEVAIGRDVRQEIARIGAPVRHYSVQEIADPARGPSRMVVIVTAGLALAVLVLAILWFAGGFLRGTGGEVATSAPTVAAAPTATTPAAAQAIPADAPVVLAARDEVWMRVYDADGNRLFLGTMKPGERFQVPATAKDPMINIGRPDKLDVTVGGRAVAPLGDGKRALKDVKISAPALLARNLPAPTPTASSAAASPSRPATSAATSPRITPAPTRKPLVSATSSTSPATQAVEPPPFFRPTPSASASAPAGGE